MLDYPIVQGEITSPCQLIICLPKHLLMSNTLLFVCFIFSLELNSVHAYEFYGLRIVLGRLTNTLVLNVFLQDFLKEILEGFCILK